MLLKFCIVETERLSLLQRCMSMSFACSQLSTFEVLIVAVLGSHVRLKWGY